MTDKRDDDALLEAHFQAARRQAPAPAEDMLTRVLADATQVQAGFAPAPAAAADTSYSGIGGWFRALGGWPALSGLSAATVAGLWIGLAPPAGLASSALAMLGADSYVIDLDPGAGFGFGEEAS